MHFTTNSLFWERVFKMGENLYHVCNVGSTSIDSIRKETLTNSHLLLSSLGVPNGKYALDDKETFI